MFVLFLLPIRNYNEIIFLFDIILYLVSLVALEAGLCGAEESVAPPQSCVLVEQPFPHIAGQHAHLEEWSEALLLPHTVG